ncbi:hypothetical protein AB0C10_37020 [Microbispora amethystogenes]|uniref:hypothetical protein n=1 Tax=Microbispora amethystogenes TaxID=1427754 RepID=UPI0033E38566
MSDPMTGIRQARAALAEAEKQAKAIVTAARLELGQEILKARASGAVQQKDIADELELTREQIRRLEVAAEDAGFGVPGARSRGRRKRPAEF